jgi:TPR repeat protein
MPALKPVQLAFFSYAHEDAEFALRLAKDLRAGGAAVWIDRLDIKPGQRWDRAIEDALAKCPQLLVILSPDATESTNVMDEVSLALEEGKTVLPVVYRQCKIPFRLRRLQYVDLTLNYDEGLGRLLETLGFAVPPSEVPEHAVDEEITPPSRHDGGAKEAKLPSHAAPQEQEATARMPKKRAPSVMVIVGTAAVLVALALLVVVVNVIKQQKKRPSEQTAEGPSPQATQLTANALRTSKPTATVSETPVTIDAAAQYELAQKYEKGIGVTKNSAKALELYEESAKSGYAPAQFTLGVSYERGQGVSKDLAKAVALYQQAADQGNSDAQTSLGRLYYAGQGVPKDLGKAAELFEKSADQGNAFGQMYLGHLYRNGQGVAQDWQKAAELYQKAADQGNAFAQDYLGQLYQNGQGVPKDLAKAAELYQKAADQGNLFGQDCLGQLYQNGQGVPKDLGKAAELYQKAANQGYPPSQYHLGRLYEDGQGVPKDLGKAAELYQKAGNKGYRPAIENLKRLSGQTPTPAATAKPQPGMSDMEWDTDRFGADYTGFSLPTDNPKQCEDACRSDEKCRAWTYVKPNTIRGPKPMCYLKSAIPPRQDNPNCVSGIKVAPAE